MIALRSEVNPRGTVGITSSALGRSIGRRAHRSGTCAEGSLTRGHAAATEGTLARSNEAVCGFPGQSFGAPAASLPNSSGV
jgi:hypothetical protein